LDPLAQAQKLARRLGFSLLFLSALLGFCLEAAHALKLSAYLDHPLRRELLIWGHAHGVGLALVLLVYASVGVMDERCAGVRRSLSAGSVLLPLGFVLGAVGVHESDPGVAVWLVPLGALLVLRALLTLARAAWR
jgi:hypothetical protein